MDATLSLSPSPNPAAESRNRRAWDKNHSELIPLITQKLVNRADKFVLTSRTRYAKDSTSPDDLSLWCRGNGVSVFDTSTDNTSKWFAFDIDDHSHDGLDTLGTARMFVARLREHGYNPLLVRSSRNSFHVWVAFSKPVPSQIAFRLAEHYYHTIPWDVTPEFRPTKFAENTPLGTSLRLPGIHGGRRTYSGFTPDDGATWQYTPELFLKWLREPGDDPYTLSPEIIGKVSFSENEAERVEKERAEQRKTAEFEDAYFKSTGRGNAREEFKEAKREFCERMTWKEVLAGHLVQIDSTGDAWARHAGDDQNASTQSGFLIVFGQTAATELNFQPPPNRKGLSKWEVYERIRNPSGDFSNAKRLLTELGFLKEELPDEKPNENEPQPTAEPLTKRDLKPLPHGELKLDGASKIKPRVRIANTVTRKEYVTETAAQIVDRWNGRNRQPLVIQNLTENPAVIAAAIKHDDDRDEQIRSLIVVDSIEAAHKLRETLEFLTMDLDAITREPKTTIGVWDLARIRCDAAFKRGDDEQVPWSIQTDKRGLRLNCKNKLATTAKATGFSVRSSICGHCPWRGVCELQQHNEAALLADHLIVTRQTLAFADLTAFGDRNLILTSGVAPYEIMQMETTVKDLTATVDAMLQVLDYLEHESRFLNGGKFNASELKTAGELAEEKAKRKSWLVDMRDFLKSLEVVKQGQHPSIGSITANAKPSWLEAFVSDAVWQVFGFSGETRSIDEVLRGDRRDVEQADSNPPALDFGPLLLAAMDGHMGHYDSEDDSLHVVRRNKIHELPIVALMPKVPEVPEFEGVAFDVVESSRELENAQTTLQHFVRLSQKSADATFQKALLAVVEEYKPSAVTVVTYESKLTAIRTVSDPRIQRVLTFAQASCATFMQGELVVVLGCCPIDDTEIRQRYGRKLKLDGYGVQKIEVENAVGSMQAVPLLSHREPDEIISHQGLIRRKLGAVLDVFGTAKVVVLTDVFTGLPLAESSLDFGGRVSGMVRSVLAKSGTPLSAKQIENQTGLSERAVFRELQESHYQRLTMQQNNYSDDENDGNPDSGVRISANHCIHPYRLKEEPYYTGVGSDLRRFEWLAAREVAERMNWQATTARRKIQQRIEIGDMVSNGKRGRAVRYAWTGDDGWVPRCYFCRADQPHELLVPIETDPATPVYRLAEPHEPLSGELSGDADDD